MCICCVCVGAVQQGLVYRVCGADGRWTHSKNTSECEQDDPEQVTLFHLLCCLMVVNADADRSLSFSLKRQYGQILSKFRAMYTVGYSLSLGALILALGILVTFR